MLQLNRQKERAKALQCLSLNRKRLRLKVIIPNKSRLRLCF
jgi:hypothetical protein